MSLIRVIDSSGPPSPRLLKACAAFGLGVRHRASGGPERTGAARELLDRLGPGQVALITGPSGSGKSSLLRAVGAVAAGRGERVCWAGEGEAAGVAVIDAIPGPLPGALRALAHAGLADALLLARTPEELSEGERLRFHLAGALGEVGEGPGTVLIDEFASVLDRTTARCLCHALRRWLRGSRARIVAATAHDDIGAWLEPDVHVRTH